MKRNHILIKIAKKSRHKGEPQMPEGAVYNMDKGYWTVSQNCMVSYCSPYGTDVSKKADMETGEDQKGE